MSALTKLKTVETGLDKYVKTALSQFMREHPDIGLLTWHQYTPYWNDGEPTHFRVGGLCFLPLSGLDKEKEITEYSDYDDTFDVSSAKQAAVSGSTAKDLKKLSKLLDGMEDVLRGVFGDHAQVFIGQDGKAIVTEYEHE